MLKPKNSLAKLTCVLCLFFTHAQAQQNVSGIYGSASFDLSNMQLSGDEIGSTEASHLRFGSAEFSLGRGIGTGGYLQADIRIKTTDTPDVFDDTYDQSALAVLRFGQTYQNGQYGGFIGGLTTDQDDDSSDTSIRTIFGLEGARSLGNGIWLIPIRLIIDL